MNTTHRLRARCVGFTLIELLVVMAILGTLAAALMPLGETLITAHKERELRRALREIRNALDEFKKASDQGVIVAGIGGSGYPPSLKTLVEGATDARMPSHSRFLYFLRAIPRDPFAASDIPAEQTWQLRSYASPPDKPEPGADVYDVRSSSKAKALDGTFYARW